MTGNVPAGGALAVHLDQTERIPPQAAALQQSAINNTPTHADLSVFVPLDQPTGLDPLSRQLYSIGRYDNHAGPEVYRPLTHNDDSLAGLRARTPAAMTDEALPRRTALPNDWAESSQRRRRARPAPAHRRSPAPSAHGSHKRPYGVRTGPSRPQAVRTCKGPRGCRWHPRRPG
jgi:hypothetical protein